MSRCPTSYPFRGAWGPFRSKDALGTAQTSEDKFRGVPGKMSPDMGLSAVWGSVCVEVESRISAQSTVWYHFAAYGP